MASKGNQGAVRAFLKQLDVNPLKDARGQLALTLATAIDVAADSGQLLGVASMAKELRATLNEIERGTDDHNDELAQLVAELSTPVRDTTAS